MSLILTDVKEFVPDLLTDSTVQEGYHTQSFADVGSE